MILIDSPNRHLRNRVHKLTWALVDDNMKESEWWELQSLLSASADARADYIEAMQLHVDLTLMYSKRMNVPRKAFKQAFDGR